MRLGAMVTGVMYRYPGILIKQVTTLNVLSKGRGFLGIGAAWHEHEHRAFAGTLTLSPDGQRLWAFQAGSTQLAAIDLKNLHPVPLLMDRAIHSVHDIARADGGRSLIAVHAIGTWGATVLDARAPDTANSRLFSALLLEGL